MKSFGTVLKFEINHYLKNKAFLITTFILVLLIMIGLSLPTIIDVFKSEDSSQGSDDNNISSYGLYDPTGLITDFDFLSNAYYLGDLKQYTDQETLDSDVLSGTLAGGFIINSALDYDYVVLNNELTDNGLNAFQSAYITHYQKQSFEEKGIAFEDVHSIIYPTLTHEITVLGTDSSANFLHTYILIFALYFMIIMYGQLIATAVASEKSNRTMELLVTSTKTTYLIFGKVLGGAMAGIIQFALIIGTGKLFYTLNAKAWDGDLDFLFDIPVEILLQFSVFGILGYAFFAFIFGALGALVSKTEDVNASATPVTLIFVFVFFISMTGMQNTEGIVLKIASYVPFSSFMAMFVRVSMGSVKWYEVTISLSLLVISTIFIGWISSKVYRMGTLMYGNPVKLKDLPKIMKSQ